MKETRAVSAADPAALPRRRTGRRIARGVIAALLVVAVLAGAGAVMQAYMERREAAAHPPPGELVVLSDGRAIHMQVHGEHHDGPTVVLEGGAGASSPAWAWVQPAVAEHLTVVSYDRAGLGWSDARAGAPSAHATVTDLEEALDIRGLPGPYVMVGHSIGAYFVRAFTADHPDDVVGVVLVDPSHEEQFTALGEGSDPATRGPMFAAVRLATSLGLTRLYNPFTEGLDGLPEPALTQIRTHSVARGPIGATTHEYAAASSIGREVSGQELGDVPLVVMIAGSGTSAEEQAMVDTLEPLREDLAERLSTNASIVHIESANHVSVVAEQRHAQVVVEQILEIAERASPNTR